jgi:guanylate kinase
MSHIFSGKIFLIVGPSGVGKGTALLWLKRRHPEWIFPISATTRNPRPKEKDGETYHFFSHEVFDQKIENKEFIEWAWVHGKQKYGMLKSEIFPFLSAGKVLLREVDIQGFLTARNIIPKQNICSIFLRPPSQNVLIQRIKKRAPITPKELKKRLESMKNEMHYAKECDYQIQTVDGRKVFTAQEIQKIIQKTMS